MEPTKIDSDSIEQAAVIQHPQPNSELRNIFIVLIVSWAVRLAFICMVSPGARSLDAYAWEHQAEILNAGVNPYQANHFFNWPPFWMQCVFAISKVANFLGVPFFRMLQFFLIMVESAVIIQVMRLMQRIAPEANARAIALVGIALNPVAVLLVCQHCNFDVLMVFWVLLATASLLRYNASGSLIDWLCACLFLGLGILTKTVPLALIPLLACGFRKATASGRLLGTALVLGPTALGMSIIYVLGPAGALHVLTYRAINGIYFGFPGFLHAMGMDNFAGCFDVAFYILGIGIMALTWRYLWKYGSLGDRETILYIAIVLLSIQGLGTGFASQYFYWFIPFFVISYAAYRGLWRKFLIGSGLISAFTFLMEYGLIGTYGSNFLYILSQAPTAADLFKDCKASASGPIATATSWANWFGSPAHETMERIPLFIAMLTLIVFGARLLVSRLHPLRKWVFGLAGIYALCVSIVFTAAIGAKCLLPRSPVAGGSNPNQPNHNAIGN